MTWTRYYTPRARLRAAWSRAVDLRLRLFTVAVIVSVLVLAVVAINDLSALAPVGSAGVNR